MRPSMASAPLPAFSVQRKGGDDGAGLGNRFRVRRKRLVGRLDLVGMDQRLAVKTHACRLLAFARKPLGILECVDHAVERDQPAGPRRDHHLHQQRHEIAAVRCKLDAGLLGEVVGAGDQTRQAASRIVAKLGDVRRC